MLAVIEKQMGLCLIRKPKKHQAQLLLSLVFIGLSHSLDIFILMWSTYTCLFCI